MKILIVENEVILAYSLKTLLTRQGFEVEAVYNGEDGVEYAETGMYDLMILDVMLPGLDSYQVARQVRKRRLDISILMLMARAEVSDRIEGLNAGADYYLPKPFDDRELLACINALCRRQSPQTNMLRYGNTTLDLAGYLLYAGEKQVRLSTKEFQVMRLLMQNQGRSMKKEALLVQVWGLDSTAVDNNVEVYIGFLRKKLKAIRSDLQIKTIRLIGYHLEIIKPQPAS